MGVEAAVAGAVAAPVVGGLLGMQEGAANRSAAENARNQALAQYAGLSLPDIEKQRLELALPEYIGGYQPQLEQALNLGPSSMEGLSTDPRLAEAQMNALQQLSDIGQTGLTEGEAAALRDIQRRTAGQNMSQQKQILQNMAERGVSGSGLELAAKLSASQQAGQQAAQSGDALAQAAQARALQALSQAGNLGGQIRSQEFGEKSDIAKAQDLIKQFNLQNQQGVQQRNVSSGNEAALRNLQEQQRIAEATAAQKNYQQQYNKNLSQQQFQNQLNLAGAKAGQYAGQAQDAQQNAANAAQMWSGIGSGVGTGLAAIAGQKSSTPTTTKG